MPQTRRDDGSTPALAVELEALLDRLCCPVCGGALAGAATQLTCTACSARWPVLDGLALLAREGTAETWCEGGEGREGGESPQIDETSEWYQKRYREPGEASKYNEAYRDIPTKRWSTRREDRLLERLLGRQGRVDLLLDLPCGGGRLSPSLAPHAARLVEADVAIGQVAYARHRRGDWSAAYMTASAFHIPFRDGAVDAIVCCRLCHHLPTADERERLVAELLRVAGRFVVMTFFDHDSVKNLIRRARQPFNAKPPKMTMTVRRVAELARENGAELVAAPPLSRLFSGHRYALMVKRSV